MVAKNSHAKTIHSELSQKLRKGYKLGKKTVTDEGVCLYKVSKWGRYDLALCANETSQTVRWSAGKRASALTSASLQTRSQVVAWVREMSYKRTRSCSQIVTTWWKLSLTERTVTQRLFRDRDKLTYRRRWKGTSRLDDREEKKWFLEFPAGQKKNAVFSKPTEHRFCPWLQKAESFTQLQAGVFLATF